MTATTEPTRPARNVFARLGKNFMTPTVLAYRWRFVGGKWWAVELSEGEGFDGHPIFGVTFRDPDDPDDAELELSGMFHTRHQAENWFNEGDPEQDHPEA